MSGRRIAAKAALSLAAPMKTPSPASRLLQDLCRSELAREGLKGDAFIQKARVIVNVHREQARSYIRFTS
ncbi:hypothetical protein D3C84_1158600 [compost metagenome]